MLIDHLGPIEIKILPALRVACYRAVSQAPEGEAFSVMEKWIARQPFQNPGARSFGFDTEVPTEQADQGLRGYEVWFTVPAEAAPSGEVHIQDFGGGLYAVMRLSDPFTTAFETIPGGWKHLRAWVLAQPDFMGGKHAWLEEHVETAQGVVLDLSLPIQPRSVSTSIPQEPRLVQMPALKLAGLRYEGKNQNGEVPRLWDEQFLPRYREIVRNEGKYTLYGAARWLPGAESGIFEYLAAAEVDSFDSLPEGMVGWELPGGPNCVLAVDNVPGLGPACDYFYNHWLAENGWVIESNGDYLLEVYPPEFSENGVIFLNFPVKQN
jgi:predicted transcriptional regulator YdeE